MQYKLEIENLNKSFGDLQALKDVGIQLEQGKMLAVLGPSGSGKTTLLRSITGFETPDSGNIKNDGRIMFGTNKRVKPEHRRIGYVPQDGVLFPHLSAAQNIGFGLTKSHRNGQRIDEMLELVGMAGLGQRMPHEL